MQSCLTQERKPSLFEDEAEYDEEDTHVLGSLFTHFIPDSESQLILDLDLFKHFFDYSAGFENAILEGDVDFVKYAMEAMEQLKELDVSVGCVTDIFHMGWTAVEYATHVKEHKNCTDCKCTPLFLQKKNERSWIFNVLDSMGKVPAGITGGNNLWVGSYSTCRKISVVKNAQGQKWNGQYCLAHLDAYYRDNPIKVFTASGPPDAHCKVNATVPDDSNDKRCFDLISLLNFGLCVPDTCTDYDVKKMVKFGYGLVEATVGRDLVCDVHVECRNEEQENRVANSGLSHFCRYLLSFICIMVIFGTAYDYLVYQKQLKETAEGKDQKKLYEDLHVFLKSVLAFSAYTNGKSILRTNANTVDQIDCLHGIRFLSMSWIILGHTYYYIASSLTTGNLVPTLIAFPKMFHTQIIVQAPLAVDSFFFLSGLLSSYMMFKKLFKDKLFKTVKDPIIWIMVYVRRYLRITPTYVFVMLLDVTLFSYITNGPFWRPIEKTGCRISWWTNLIYMNNFLLQDQECCMGWTWYLANDFQLQILSPLIIIPLASSLKWGLIVSGAFITMSSVAKVAIMLYFDYPPAPILTSKLQIVEKLNSYWNDVYVKPYVRCGPFIAGVLIGYLLIHLTKEKRGLTYKLSMKSNIIGWTVSTILGVYSVFGLYNYAKTGEISEWYRIMYAFVGRPAYAAAISWVTFACATGNAPYVNAFLGWKFFTPLSRITFDAYLIHPILLQIYNLSRPQPFYFTTLFQMLRHMFEAVIISYMTAFVISCCVEQPTGILEGRLMANINKLFYSKGKEEKTEKRRDTEMQTLNPPPQEENGKL